MSNLILMKSMVAAGLVAGLAVNLSAQKPNVEQLSRLKATMNQNQVSFTENKGQVYDQNHTLRPDVLFGGESKGLVFHLKNNGISYQLNKIDKWKPGSSTSGNKKDNKQKHIETSTVYRVDINWLNVNTRPDVVTAKELEGYGIFYNNDKQLTVRSFGEVTYRNMYKGIDLKWYEKDGELKYDYLCAVGSDYKNIQLQVEGARKLRINAKGELEIITPLGTITEKAPLVMQGGRKLKSQWILTNNILSFNIENLNNQLPYVIDPAVRAWGTYYGGNSFDYANACATYTNGDVYMVGSTYLNTSTIIATTGAYQSTMGGMDDAYLVKFNSSGVRKWATYYGGTDSDNGRSVAVDAQGNVYMCGITSSTNGIATAIAHQTAIGGGNLSDGFLVKFDSIGTRVWATYYGGNSSDEFHQCALDPAGNIYASGSTDLATSTVIATTGTHQNSFGGGPKDGFLVKFDANGGRQWGTYYGGTDVDFGNSCAADANNVYLAGITSSTNSAMVSATNCHQNTFGGSLYDAYLVKFNNINGTRVWATFYGGNAIDFAYGCAADASGNVYMCGVTTTSVAGVIATSVSHQSVGATAGDDEAYLVQFNSFGTRMWGTYYGGNANDDAYGCAVNANGDVYLVGTTSSTLSSAIATPGSHQTVLGTSTGGINAFLAKFNTGGTRQWGTYYGGDGEDGNGCSTVANGDVYLCGPTNATLSSAISTPGSHQATLGGIYDGYLVKFTDCNSQAPTNVTSATNQVICAGNAGTLSATAGTSTITWYATATSTQAIGTGTNYTTASNLSIGSYTFYAESAGCAGNSPRTGITVTVSATPTISASGGTVCSGQSFTIAPSGASTYSILDNSTGFPTTTIMVVSPLTTSSFVIAGTGSNGCMSNYFGGVASITVTVNTPTITVNSGTICNGSNFTLVPSGGLTYTYQSGNVVSPTANSTYTVVGVDGNGCTGVATASVTVAAPSVLSVNSGAICFGSSFTISPSGGSNYTISTGGKVVSSVVSPTATTNYTITGKSPEGCVVAKNVICKVTVNPPPRTPFPSTITVPAYIAADVMYYKNGDYKLTLEPSSNLVTLYSPATSNDVPTLFASGVTTAMIFTVNAVPYSNGHGACPGTYTLLVNPEEDPSKYWEFPNFLSPNNDGLNDDWMPSYKGVNFKNVNNSPENYLIIMEGINLIKNIKIVNFFTPQLEYYTWIYKEKSGYVDGDQTPILWNTVAEQIKEATFCTLKVNFENGTEKKILIGVNSKSNQ